MQVVRRKVKDAQKFDLSDEVVVLGGNTFGCLNFVLLRVCFSFYICRSHPVSAEAEVGLAHPSLPKCCNQGTWDKQDFPASQACGRIHLLSSDQQGCESSSDCLLVSA